MNKIINQIRLAILLLLISYPPVSFALDVPPANGNYQVFFENAASADYDFVYYERLSDDTVSSPIYYKIFYSPSDATNNRVLNYKNTSNISLTDDFVENTYVSERPIFGYGESQGGALNNYGSTITAITGDFIKNSNTATGANRASGAAIYNFNDAFAGAPSVIGDVQSNFIGNYLTSVSGGAYGGAVVNASSNPATAAYINTITGSFIGNSSTASDSYSIGGAIYSYAWGANSVSRIGEINGDFIGNSIVASGSGSPSNSYTQGGAIYQHGRGGGNASIGDITGDFIGNFSMSAFDYAEGGAIANLTINESGGPVSRIGNITGNFIGNYVDGAKTSRGGAVYNNVTQGTAEIGTIDGSFIGNHAAAYGNFLAIGGAAFANTNLTFGADGRDNLFSGNYTYDKWGKVYNAIGIFSATVRTLSFILKNGGSVTLNDQIETGGAVSNTATSINYATAHHIVIKGEQNAAGNPVGNITFNNSLVNINTITATDVIMTLGSYRHSGTTYTAHGIFANPYSQRTQLTLNNSFLKLDYETFQTLKLSRISSANNSYIMFGADFSTGASDSINALTANASESINLRAFNITGGSFTTGASVDLFTNHTNGYLNIGNISSFRLIYDGRLYELSYSSGTLKIASDSAIPAYPIYVPSTGAFSTTDIENTDMNSVSPDGVLVNDGVLTINKSGFSGNSNKGNAYNAAGNGGVILNGSSGIGELLITSSAFTLNVSSGSGGAVYNDNGSRMTIINTSFTGNKAYGRGGAIYNDGTFTLTADGAAVTFSGNTDSTGANDIYVGAGKSLDLKVENGGSLSFFSGISGDTAGYDINIKGDADSKVNINAKVKNASNIYLSNAELKTPDYGYLNNLNFDIDHGFLNLSNSSFGTFNINNLSSVSGMIAIDVDPDKNKSTLLNINGDLSGEVKLILNVSNAKEPGRKILFANTPNDDVSTDGRFSVYRVNGSPFTWDAEPSDTYKQWYLSIRDKHYVYPEVLAYMGLHVASVEQTRGMFSAVKTNTESSNIYGSGKISDTRQEEPLYDIWASPVYSASTAKYPIDIESRVYGTEAGFDIQKSEFHRLGLFVSYRHGRYDIDGKGKEYYTDMKSNIDIDSYLGGLYYSYDNGGNWIFATVFGGVQKAEFETFDNVEIDTDGQKLGLGINLGHTFSITETFDIIPEAGAYYQENRFNDITDAYGKTAKFDNFKLTELEAGIIFKKTVFLFGKEIYLHLKPAVIQEFVSGNNVNITGLGDVDTYESKTLGSGVFGIDTDISRKINIGAAGVYTAGQDYEFYGARLLFTYRFPVKTASASTLKDETQKVSAEESAKTEQPSEEASAPAAQEVKPVTVPEETEAPAKDKTVSEKPVKIAEPKFAFDSSALSDASKQELDEAAEKIAKNPALRVKIIGHTDSVGTDQYNIQLSVRRAKSAYNYMLKKGASEYYMHIEGKGFHEPIAPNTTPAGRAKNRRVEVYVYESGE